MTPRVKCTFLLSLLFLLCSSLWACGTEADSQPQPEYDWTQSEFEDEIPAPAGVLMEMAYEAYGVGDEIISYVLSNTTTSPVLFSDAFSLESFQDGEWLAILLNPELGPDDTLELQGMQMCRVDLDISQLGMPFPEGLYRIIIMVEDLPCAAEYTLSEERIDARQMHFGYEPLDSLPPEFDIFDAENEGYYTITENGSVNADSVQRFADKVSLNVPAKLRTAILLEDGGTLIRDIVFDLSPDGYGRFYVTVDSSRASSELARSDQVYSFMSLATVGNKKKVCLSNYVSYDDYAPIGAALELISPETPDNIDLVATVGLRTENNMVALEFGFLAFGADDVSFVTIARGGETFSVKTVDLAGTDISPADTGVKLTGAVLMSSSQVLLYGVMADEESYEALYNLEGLSDLIMGPEPDPEPGPESNPVPDPAPGP